MKVRLIQAGAATFEYPDNEADAAAIRTALAQWTGGTAPGMLYDVTDMDRSDTDPDEYLIIREDDGTVLWEGWLGGVDGPAPADAENLRAIITEMATAIRAEMRGDSSIRRAEVIDWTKRAGVDFDIYAEGEAGE